MTLVDLFLSALNCLSGDFNACSRGNQDWFFTIPLVVHLHLMMMIDDSLVLLFLHQNIFLASFNSYLNPGIRLVSQTTLAKMHTYWGPSGRRPPVPPKNPASSPHVITHKHWQHYSSSLRICFSSSCLIAVLFYWMLSNTDFKGQRERWQKQPWGGKHFFFPAHFFFPRHEAKLALTRHSVEFFMQRVDAG